MTASSCCAPTQRITSPRTVLRYRDLIQVEQSFHSAKDLTRTRPTYHSSDIASRGPLFRSFVALVLRKVLDARCGQLACTPNGATC